MVHKKGRKEIIARYFTLISLVSRKVVFVNSLDLSKLPNFFIIGAPKAGTTSLFNILETHPQVYGSSVKETGFFSKDDRYNKGLIWYQETFFQESQGFPVRMEATPTYLTWSEKTAHRIHDNYPVPTM